MVQTSLLQEEAQEEGFIIPYNVSVMKSAMQKHIRRGNAQAAIKVAKSLIHKDPHGAARRIMIVVVEEAILHPLYARMPAIIDRLSKKGTEPIKEERDILLTLVRDAAEAPLRDFFIGNPNEKHYTQEQFGYMGDEEKKLVRSLIYRAQIGGMRSDISMLQSLVRIWVNRFTNGWNVNELKQYFPSNSMVDWNETEYMTGDDIPYYAIDFHCFPPGAKLIVFNQKKPEKAEILQLFIKQHLPDLAHDMVEAIKKTMWCYQVSMNTKPNIWGNQQPIDWMKFERNMEWREPLRQLDELMKEDWRAIANWYIKKMESNE